MFDMTVPEAAAEITRMTNRKITVPMIKELFDRRTLDPARYGGNGRDISIPRGRLNEVMLALGAAGHC